MANNTQTKANNNDNKNGYESVAGAQHYPNNETIPSKAKQNNKNYYLSLCVVRLIF